MAMGAMQKLGVGAFLTLSGKGYIDEMSRARDATGKFIKVVDLLPPGLKQAAMASMFLNSKIKQMTRGLGMVGSGLQSMGMASLPISAGLALGVKQAADFEKQMKAVEAVTSFSVDQYKDLGALSKQIGIETQYDPKQVGQLMEGMGRAGATYKEVMGGTRGIASAAAAEQMDLATAQNVVTQSARIMGISLSKASKIADSYAKLSANANTNITELGNAFRYAGPSARKMGMDFDTTISFLAKLGDAGLKGSIGGTALQNMLNKITRRSKAAQRAMKSMEISLVDQNKKFRPMSDILGDVVKGLSGMENEEKRAALVTDLFGIRGERAYLAFSTQGKKSFEDMIEMSKKASDETDKNGKVVGAAYLMAQKRLEGLSGRLTLFRGSLATFAIEAGEEINRIFAGVVGSALKAFNRMLGAFSKFDSTIGTFDGLGKLRREFGTTAVDVVLGFKDALKTIKWVITTTIDKVKELGAALAERLGDNGVRKITKFVTLFTVVLGLLGPIALAMWPIKMLLGGIVTVASGLATVFWPATVAILFFASILSAIKRDNETWGEAANRVWTSITDTISELWTVYLEPFIHGIRDVLPMAIEDVGRAFESLGETLDDFFSGWTDNIDKSDQQIKNSAYGWGVYFIAFTQTIMSAIINIVKIIMMAVDLVITPFKILWQAVMRIITSIQMIFSGNVLEGFKRLGLAILDFVLMPFRTITKAVINFAKLVGYELPKGVEAFAEKGITGFVMAADNKALNKWSNAKVAPPEKATQTQLDSMGAIMASKASEKTAIAEGFKLGMDAYSPNGFAVTAKIDNKMCIDGEAGNRAFARNSIEVKERMGMKSSPYQYKTIREHGIAASTT